MCMWQIIALKDGKARTMWEQIGGRLSILGPEQYGHIDWLMYVCFSSFILFCYLMGPFYGSIWRAVYLCQKLFLTILSSSLLVYILLKICCFLQFWRHHCWFSWSKRGYFKVCWYSPCSSLRVIIMFESSSHVSIALCLICLGIACTIYFCRHLLNSWCFQRLMKWTLWTLISFAPQMTLNLSTPIRYQTWDF